MHIQYNITQTWQFDTRNYLTFLICDNVENVGGLNSLQRAPAFRLPLEDLALHFAAHLSHM